MIFSLKSLLYLSLSKVFYLRKSVLVNVDKFLRFFLFLVSKLNQFITVKLTIPPLSDQSFALAYFLLNITNSVLDLLIQILIHLFKLLLKIKFFQFVSATGDIIIRFPQKFFLASIALILLVPILNLLFLGFLGFTRQPLTFFLEI